MIVGFTGTQKGMTAIQRRQLRWTLIDLYQEGMTQFHHGMCVGADEQAHDLVKEQYPFGEVRVVGHPGTDDEGNSPKRMEYNPKDFWEVMVPLPYLVRNVRIVDIADVLIVCPQGNTETMRSGTWSTYRQGKKKGKSIKIIYPNGAVSV